MASPVADIYTALAGPLYAGRFAPPPPPPPAPTTATLSGAGAAIAGEAASFAVTLNDAADQTYTVTLTVSNGGIVTPNTRDITAGQTVAWFSVTWADAGASRTVDFTISPSLTRLGRPITLTVSAAPDETTPAISFKAPGAAAMGEESEPIMVGVIGEPFTGDVVVTLADDGAGGSFSPPTVTLSNTNRWATARYTPAKFGVVFLRATNDRGFHNPLPKVVGVSTVFTLPASPPPPKISINYGGRAGLTNVLNFRDAQHEEGRYDRWQRLIVLDASTGTMVHPLRMRMYNQSGSGFPQTVQSSSYNLLIAPKEDPDNTTVVDTVVTTPGVTQTFDFSIDVSGFAAGWYIVSASGLAAGERVFPLAIYIKKAAVEPDPDWMPVQSVKFDYEFADINYFVDWVPARFGPQLLPLKHRTFQPFNTHESHLNLWREKLVLGHGLNSITRRPNRTASGVLNTAATQSYHFFHQTSLTPPVQCIDGPRGMGVIGMPTHIQTATAAPNGVLRRTTYVLDAWALRKIHEDGYVETLVGYRHKGIARYFQDPRPVYYPAGQANTPEGALELIGDWDDIPEARRGMHEAWGFAWDPRTLGVNTSAPPIPGEHGDQPHVVGPAGFIADTQNNRILKVQFRPADRRPPKVTEFITTTPAGILDDPWDVVFDPTDNTLIISERKRHRIIKCSADTGAFVGVVVQGLAYGVITSGRESALTTDLATARTADTVLPEGLYLHDGHCYYGSLAQRQIRRVNLTTLAVEIVVPETGRPSGSTYHKIAVSDGSFHPAGTVFVAGWNQLWGGVPHCYRPDGVEIKLGENSFNGRRSLGHQDGRMPPVSNYSAAVGVGGGRLVFGVSGEGIYELSLKKTTDPSGALNTTDATLVALLGTPQSSGANLYAHNGWNLRYGEFYYGEPLPWGLNANLDGYLAHLGYVTTTAIYQHPASISVAEGVPAVFICRATGPGAPWFQWQISTNGGSSWSDIAGETGHILEFVAATAGQDGHQFRCVVATTAGAVTSSAATLSVTA